jgi:hypothetical protein
VGYPALPPHNWKPETRLTVELGYFDQAHFIKDF